MINAPQLFDVARGAAASIANVSGAPAIRGGVASALIAPPLHAAWRAGAPALNAYPFDAPVLAQRLRHALRVDFRPARVQGDGSAGPRSPRDAA
jgi:hypothetical protein